MGRFAAKQLTRRQALSDRSPSAKVLTIMMTDIVGSAALRRARGDRDADDLLGLQATIVHEKVIAFGGSVRKSLGDGFLISFPSTVTAVSAAAAIERALHEYNIANPQRTFVSGMRVRVRIAQSRSASAFTSARSPSATATCSGRPCTSQRGL